MFVCLWLSMSPIQRRAPLLRSMNAFPVVAGHVILGVWGCFKQICTINKEQSFLKDTGKSITNAANGRASSLWNARPTEHESIHLIFLSLCRGVIVVIRVDCQVYSISPTSPTRVIATFFEVCVIIDWIAFDCIISRSAMDGVPQKVTAKANLMQHFLKSLGILVTLNVPQSKAV